MIPRPIWTLGFSLITWLIPSPNPTLKPPLSPVNQKSSLVHTTHAFWVTPGKLLPEKGSHCSDLQSFSCPAMPWGNINVEHIYQSGNQFQGHSHQVPLPPNHPLTINDIGPPIALAMEVIIVSPLIPSYKYEKLGEEEGC